MKIPDEKLKLIDKLLDKDISIAQIAREVNLTYSCVYNYKAARIKGFNSFDEYQKHLTPKKVSETKIKLMEELFAKNLSYAEIARKTNLAYQIIYSYAKARKRGFKSYNEYQSYLEELKMSVEKIKLMEKLFREGLSIVEIAKKTNSIVAVVYLYTRAKQRGFASPQDYRNYLSRKRGFKNAYEYKLYMVNQKKSRENKKPSEFGRSTYNTRNSVKRSEFTSKSEYEKYLRKRRQNQSINKELGLLIRKQLKEIGKKRSWLANQLGINTTTVSGYILGITKPTYRLQKKFFKLLKLPYQTIEDFSRAIDSKKKKVTI